MWICHYHSSPKYGLYYSERERLMSMYIEERTAVRVQSIYDRSQLVIYAMKKGMVDLQDV
jgi:hypothetical protein